MSHPVVEAAARGELPGWARMGKERRAHVRRVAELVERWAEKGEVDDETRTRWLAAAWLHDALKELPEKELRALVGPEGDDLPAPVLHGPAAAARMRQDGVEDEELLRAVAYHTVGHPDMGETGRILYAADFLEPERRMRRKWRAGLRMRMPHDQMTVVKKIARARIEYLLRKGRPVRPETVALWNSITGGESWARAFGV